MAALSSLGYINVEGCDLDTNKIEVALARNINVKAADALEFLLSKSHGSIDCILCVDFLEHIPKSAIESYIAAISTKLRSGGTFISRMPNPDSPFFARDYFNDPTHQWCYTLDAFTLILKQHNLVYGRTIDGRLNSIKKCRILLIPLTYISRLLFAILMIFLGVTHRFNTAISPSVWHVVYKE
jgi:2-polyprenyl-3-methyl-5-hydroxy-6-metoxy-1,4-benzoquinol methylase